MSAPERTPDEGAFAEPWQATAFAMAVTLSERGLFTWSEWAETLGAEIKAHGAAYGSDYYERWLAALETLLKRKSVAQTTEIADLTAAWQRAEHATPHGKPILLENDPERA